MSASSCREYSGDVVPMWMTVCSATLWWNWAVPRLRTASTECSSAIIMITPLVRANSCSGLEASRAPAARSGSHLAWVRFQTTRSVPARARLSAMG
jgi:hypothetical protein